jgi:hypothetical protein
MAHDEHEDAWWNRIGDDDQDDDQDQGDGYFEEAVKGLRAMGICLPEHTTPGTFMRDLHIALLNCPRKDQDDEDDFGDEDTDIDADDDPGELGTGGGEERQYMSLASPRLVPSRVGRLRGFRAAAEALRNSGIEPTGEVRSAAGSQTDFAAGRHRVLPSEPGAFTGATRGRNLQEGTDRRGPDAPQVRQVSEERGKEVAEEVLRNSGYGRLLDIRARERGR